MRILKNKCLVLLVAMLVVPAWYLLCVPAAGVSALLFVVAMLMIVWAANEAAEQKPYEGAWVDPDWMPSKDDGKKTLPCFHWNQ